MIVYILGQLVHKIIGRGGVWPQRGPHNVSGGVTPAVMPVVGAVRGQRCGDGLAEHHVVFATFAGDDVSGALRHDVHHVQRAVHLREKSRQ